MLSKIFKKRTHVQPYKGKWMVTTYDNVFQSFIFDLRNYGIKVAINNLLVLLEIK